MNTITFLIGAFCTAAGMLWMASVIERGRPHGPIRGPWFADPILPAVILIGAGVIMLIVTCVRDITGQRHRQQGQSSKNDREDDAGSPPTTR